MSNALIVQETPAGAVGTGRGNEEIGVEHVTIPRLKLLQKMSDEVDENHEKYVQGAKPGNWMNSITEELMTGAIYVVNIKFTESYAVWKKRELGGGFLGSRKTLAEAQEILDAQEKPGDFQIQHNHTHLLLIANPETGELGKPILMDFNSSKLSVSKKWNAQIVTKGGDRFAGLWKLEPVGQTNKSGQKYFNLKADFAGFLTPELYAQAEEVYEQFAGSAGVEG